VISFNGNEEDIYGLAGPHLVEGLHSRLITATLRPGETVLHLALCPVWHSRSRPFDIQAAAASHALCLTDARLLVARVPLASGAAPTTFAIERRDLLGFDFGQAVLMSWLALHVRRGDRTVAEGFYFPRHGNQHVAALLRSWRSSWPVCCTGKPVLCRDHIAQSAGHFHERLVTTLLTPDEDCLRAEQRPPIWGSRMGWFGSRPVGLAHAGTLLLTDRAFWYVRGQAPAGGKGYVLAHNVSCYSLASLTLTAVKPERRARTDCARLDLTFGAARAPGLEILFPAASMQAARDWAQELASLSASPG
jgi:hypothetical protein